MTSAEERSQLSFSVRPHIRFTTAVNSSRSTMAKYLISFPSAAMVVPDGEWGAVGRDAHAVIDEAKAAGVYVFGGGIDEDVPRLPVRPTVLRVTQGV
jgi:hypothetical protein